MVNWQHKITAIILALFGLAETAMAVANLYVSPTNLSNVVLKGYNATNQTFGISAGAGSMAYTVTADDGGLNWLSVSSSTGMVSGGTTNTLTNTYLTTSLSPADYTGRVMVAIATPEPPGQVNASKGDYEDRVAVNWWPVVSPVDGAVSYNVLRYTTFDVNYAQTIVSGLTVTNYDDTTAQPGARYYYWVRSVNSYGQIGTNSAYDDGYRRLAAPAGVFATDGEYTNKVVVSWSTVDGASSYYVYRGTGGLVDLVYHTSGTGYDDSQVQEGVEYTYWLQATNTICGSVLSTGEVGSVLGRPIGLAASDGDYVGRVALSWNAVSGATVYEVWRSIYTLTPPAGGGAKIGEASATSYSDTTVTAGVTYYYWAKAKNATALSELSDRAEGYAATAALDLSVWGLVVQPRRIGAGGSPRVVSFRLTDNGGSALSGDNGSVRLTFYASGNDVFGDGDDVVIGTVDRQLTMGIGSSAIVRMTGGDIVLPNGAGPYYIYMRLAPVWPSTLAATSVGGWVVRRADTLTVSASGSINYQALNDYDGDGVSDLIVHGIGLWDGRAIDGYEYAQGAAFGGSGVAVMGDYDGDGKTDPVVYDESHGFWQILLSGNGYSYGNGYFGGPGYLAVPGDYDGDGKTEAAVYDEAHAMWYALKVGGGIVMWELRFGSIGYEPVIGDYDGDGKWDLAVYDEDNGLWYIRSISGTLILSGRYWGGTGFRPVTGDYDGDGIWDLAVYDEATGRWYVETVGGTVIAAGILWGADGYMPVAGDFNGDGLADLAVYNKSTGNWYIRTVSGTWLLLNATWGGNGRNAVGEVE